MTALPDLTCLAGPGQHIIVESLNSLPPSAVPAFLDDFRASNRLASVPAHVTTVLSMGGVDSCTFHQAVSSAMLSALLARIPALAAAKDYDTLKPLFNTVFYNSTADAAFRVVAAAIFDACGEAVFDHTWCDTVHLDGYAPEAPYFALPYRMRACVWARHESALRLEVDRALARVVHLPPAPPVFEWQASWHGDSGAVVQEIVGIVYAAKDSVAAFGVVLDTFVAYAARESVGQNLRLAVANVLLEFLTLPDFACEDEDDEERAMADGKDEARRLDLGGKADDLYTDMVMAATLICSCDMGTTGVSILAEANAARLVDWLRGINRNSRTEAKAKRPASTKITALILHSSLAQASLATELMHQLSDAARKVPKPSLDFLRTSLKDRKPVVDLTHLVWSSIRAKEIIVSGNALKEQLWRGVKEGADGELVDVGLQDDRSVFATFFPPLLVVMGEDAEVGFGERLHMPAAEIEQSLTEAMRAGALERRILSTYALQLSKRWEVWREVSRQMAALEHHMQSQPNEIGRQETLGKLAKLDEQRWSRHCCLSGISRLALVLMEAHDAVAGDGTVDIGGEGREKTVCYGLIHNFVQVAHHFF